MTRFARPARRTAGLFATLAAMLALGVSAPAVAQDDPAAEPVPLDPAAAPVEIPPLEEDVPAEPEGIDPFAVVATVNGEPILELDLAFAAEDFGDQLAQIPGDSQRQALIDAVIDMRLMAVAAVEAGLDQSRTFASRMEHLRQRELRNVYFAEMIDGAVTDEELQARYQAEIAALDLPEEYWTSHILVETEDMANNIIAQLNDGADFAALATQFSIDGSAAQGGDLGYYAIGQLIPEFEQAALALEAGTYTQNPVASQFGYHIILLHDRRTQPPPAYADVARTVRQLVVVDAYRAALSELREGAEIVITDPLAVEEDAAPGDEIAPADDEEPAAEPAPAEDEPAADEASAEEPAAE
ncbi:MAG: peptidylprolyl isomerase [Bauldia sp.]|nr:peptidylprolyl isomerase [Bauldia sp.]